ncbi:MAG: lipoate--protein ligase family protein [Massilibacteroides sp.]|nr:lipoate--protein ligase family protein [Massilibacteroides sp.]MDD3061205.1 lipoate--protein ligase family protein [Massilibacteroides sp.]MDD4115574.1 lipoate--protein ligase family protein [Massilibacteroides sp.]MDD4661099.1 lipoate--protein ligase family protein [Massilibacteroides sp.]
MLCIDNRITDVYFNLAAEEYFLKESRENIFMLWQSEASVIVGKHQDIYTEVNLDYVQTHKIKIARRFSGGGAVYHDQGNLNLTFIETSIHADFDIFSRRILSMLSSLGIEAAFDARRAIHIDGLKISGSAQSIHKDRVLFHATLLFSSDLEKLSLSLERPPHSATIPSKRKIAVKSVKSPVTNLSSYITQPTNLEELRDYILNYYVRQGYNNKKYTFTPKDRQRILELKNLKYAMESWINDGEFLKI